jgi:hypothetical protein
VTPVYSAQRLTPWICVSSPIPASNASLNNYSAFTWKPDGCKLVEERNISVICSCDHFGYFALAPNLTVFAGMKQSDYPTLLKMNPVPEDVSKLLNIENPSVDYTDLSILVAQSRLARIKIKFRLNPNPSVSFTIPILVLIILTCVFIFSVLYNVVRMRRNMLEYLKEYPGTNVITLVYSSALCRITFLDFPSGVLMLR